MFSIRLRAALAFLLMIGGLGWVILCSSAPLLSPSLVTALGFSSVLAMKQSMPFAFLPVLIGFLLIPTFNQSAKAKAAKAEKHLVKQQNKRAKKAAVKNQQQRLQDIRDAIYAEIDVFGSVCELYRLDYDQTEVLQVAQKMVKEDARLRLGDFHQDGLALHVVWMARHMR